MITTSTAQTRSSLVHTGGAATLKRASLVRTGGAATLKQAMGLTVATKPNMWRQLLNAFEENGN